MLRCFHLDWPAWLALSRETRFHSEPRVCVPGCRTRTGDRNLSVVDNTSHCCVLIVGHLERPKSICSLPRSPLIRRVNMDREGSVGPAVGEQIDRAPAGQLNNLLICADEAQLILALVHREPRILVARPAASQPRRSMRFLHPGRPGSSAIGCRSRPPHSTTLLDRTSTVCRFGRSL